MTHDDLDLVRDVLTERARRVDAPSAGLAGRARRRARARRRHQGYGVLAAAGVVVAVALASNAVLPAGGVRRADPVHGPVAVVDLHVPEGAVTRFDPGTLAAGAAPRRAWVLEGARHSPDGGTGLLPSAAWGAVESPCPDVVLAVGGLTPAPALWEVDPATGRVRSRLSTGPPVRRSDGQVSYLEPTVGRGAGSSAAPARLVTWRSDCTVETSVVPPSTGTPSLVGYLGAEAVVVNVPGKAARVLRLDGSWTLLPGLARATATDERDTVASRSRRGGCLEVRRAGVRLWRACGVSPTSSLVAFSPDGHHVLLRHADVVNPAETDYAVVATETGAVKRLFLATGGSRHGGIVQAVFEDDSHLLIAAYQDGTNMLVRCELTGGCERAVTPTALPGASWPRAPLAAVEIF